MPENNVRVRHEVLYARSQFYERDLKNACKRAEDEGMVMTTVQPDGLGYAVVVFIGAEQWYETEEKDVEKETSHE